MPISDSELQILIEKIALDHNWDLQSYKWPTLKRRISMNMTETGFKDIQEYCDFLQSNPEHYKKLINSLTVNYTYWFRDEEVWDWILKIMLQKSKEKNNIKIWSAGCSTGQEPYSLAILAKKIKDDSKNKDLNFTIHASDIDDVALDKAKKGLFDKSFVNIHEDEQDKYFIDHGKELEIKTELKDMVRFSNIDLAKTAYPRGLDLILCRNVMIYFEKSLQSQIYRDFHYCLQNEGYLIAGKTEVLPANIRHLFTSIDLIDHIFQKA